MSQTNEAVVTAYLSLSWNTGKFNLIKDFLSPDFHYTTTFSEEILDLNQYIEFIKTFRKAMPGLTIQINDVMSKDDRVMTSVDFSGLVEKPIFGIPASDNIVSFPAISFWTVRNGKIASLNTLVDISGIERQLQVNLQPDKPLEQRSTHQ